jgi:ABC-type lipoprotein release transport system permease subunit
VSQVVGERSPEIGVRMALGARPAQILIQFLRYGLAWGTAGVAIGLAAATYAQRWLKELLFDIQPLDASTFGAASAGVLLIALTAVWWPAWRASRIDPHSVLRHE